MGVDKIEQLDKLLATYIGESKTIVDTKISRLTAPGDNYGSILLKVDITLENKHSNDREELYAVAKLIPEDEFFRKIFNIQVSCKVEIAVYDTIVPTLQRFQREKGVEQVIDFFPKMLAARINLNGTDVVDENAVLMLENLAQQGYKNVDRLESFDLPTTQLILKDLAGFHAVPLALKMLEPETFQSKIQPHLVDHNPPPPDKKDEGDPMEVMYEILESDEECRLLIPKLRGKMKLWAQPERREPFATIGHGDLWVNNTMVKFEEGRPVSNKFVDFQGPRYMSPAVDLFFLLWTSVRQDVLEQFDELVRFYHDHFIRHLQQLKCDTAPFSLDKFLEELKAVSEVELGHVIFFTTFVVFQKNTSDKIKLPHKIKIEDVSDIAKERLIFFVRICKEKGWI